MGRRPDGVRPSDNGDGLQLDATPTPDLSSPAHILDGPGK